MASSGLQVGATRPATSERRPKRQLSRLLSEGLESEGPPPALRQSRILGGTFDYHAHHAGSRYGPSSPAELAWWPRDVVKKLVAGESGRLRGARLQSLFRMGVAVHSDCTGRMTAEIVLRMFALALRQNGIHVGKDWLALWRGCDISDSSQQLMQNSGSHRPVHIFPSLEARIPPTFQPGFKELCPTADATDTERAERHRLLESWLLQHRRQLFGTHIASKTCLIHPGCPCNVSFQTHTAPSQFRPLSFGFVSPPCTPFSSFGKQNWYEHPHMLAVLLALTDISSCGYDVVFVEESDRFPMGLLEKVFPRCYRALHATFGPEDRMGWGRSVGMGGCVGGSPCVWLRQ